MTPTGEVSRDMVDMVRKINAQISFFLHIPFPEQLDDDTWMEKYRQVEYLAEAGLLGPKNKDK